ncbi:3-oxoacyl-[acyl-carrier-protein] synthase-3 [Actinopolymorpha cephalotaxi]|uniref:Beta-ketoacyl-[acyl-carrier-protein] synthase III n=1 Tax=Actinopolymorpha cephalotaxi TaxID=504797 RepID=A0A1I2TLD0_9ACTN|nr:beta-ketoacyl-ACP synthase III [Actinopolymorpha cephalotaxi]NYH83136.1 3-oxoacyl-[acyl-carrier-protein] synthase-3 [Actinopolymorpha cephalotaxi]SFG65690.1 3-oxoacyl-[acyl-carrier-protein] synthase-3 [Actinopolymorpha cephalotaxi]
MTGAIRTLDGTRDAGVLGVGSYRPHRIVTNAEICERIDSSDEWIRTRSGIVSRRWAGPEETVAAMSVAAAGKALAAAGIRADQLGCVLVATVSHLSQTPAVAPIIATELGAQGVAAFDISAACAGFCYGLELARSMVSSGTATYVLVIGVERLSDLTDPQDRSTAFLFGDGAGAAVVGPTDEPGIGPVVWGSDGAQADAIRQKESWDDAVSDGDFPHLTMQGNPVFRWASYEMAKVAQQALDRAGVDVQDLDAFIPHQANNRITDAMVKALKLPGHVVIARDIAEQGNTSAASIPLALDRLLAASEVRSGDTALVIGFGAGLVYAAQVIRIP